MEEKFNIAIIGHGYVGKAVDYGFSTASVQKHIVDPIYDHKIPKIVGPNWPSCDYYKDLSALAGETIHMAFVCVPTPFGKNGEIDSSIVESVVTDLAKFTCPIIIKSTVTPDIVDKLYLKNKLVVYNPEFLTEKNALDDFVNPPMHIFGGSRGITNKVQEFYENNSNCKPCAIFHMTAKEAAFVKYGINSFLATKVLWMNQFKDIVDNMGCNYNKIINAISTDIRVGPSHTQVPGPEGKRGFGGACFPKDTQAFANFAKTFTVLEEVIKQNNIYRSQYELDDREKEQKVVYIQK